MTIAILLASGGRSGFSILITAFSVVLIAGAPYFRGYFFYSTSDAYKQLAIARDLFTGSFDIRFVPYPGLHELSVVLSRLLGLSLENSMLLCVPIFMFVFVIFTIAATRDLGGEGTKSFAAIVAGLFVPIMTFNLPTLEAIPATVAILFLMFLILLCVMTLLRRRSKRLVVVDVMASAALVIYHPQVAVAFAGVLIVAGLVDSVLREQRLSSLLFDSSVSLGIATFATSFLWLSGKPIFRGSLFKVVGKIVSGIGFGSTVTSRTAAAKRISGSLSVLALKIFGSKILLGLLATATIIWGAVRVHQGGFQNRRWRVSAALISGSISIIIPLGIYASIGNLSQYTRYTSMLLLGVVIFGAIGATALQHRSTVGKTVVTLGLIVCLIMSIPATHQSPYIYKGSSQVSASEFAGYRTAFQYSDLPVGSTRSPVRRYPAAVFGDSATRQGGAGVKLANISQSRVRAYYAPYHWNETTPTKSIPEKVLLVVTDRSYQIDVDLYDGARFTKAEYEMLDQSSSIARPIDTGGFVGYIVHPRTQTTNATSESNS